MVNKTTKPEAKIILNLKPGSVTLAQKTAWRKWWAARIAEAKKEASR